MNKYYDDYRLFTFIDRVSDVIEENGKFWVGSASSCFFIGGGGMDKEKGWLNGLPVYDVKYKDGKYYHLVDQALSGQLQGEVDYQRRIRNVQIHTAQHLISAYLGNKYNLETISHHVSESDNDIVFKGDSLDLEIEEIQEAVNGYLLTDLAVSIEYPDINEINQRVKAEKLDHEELRVVRIGDLDYNLCGCLHVSHLAEIGVVFIKEWEKTKEGGIIRYLAGWQLIDYWRPRYDQLNLATRKLALDHLEIVMGIEKLQRDNKDLHYSLQQLRQEKLINIADGHLSDKQPLILALKDLEVKDGQFMVSYLHNQGFDQAIALVLELGAGQCHVLISCATASQIWEELSAQFNLRGGGSKINYQGGGKYDETILLWLQERIGEV